MNITKTNVAFSSEDILKGLYILGKISTLAVNHNVGTDISSSMVLLGMDEDEARKFMSAEMKVDTHVREDLAKSSNDAKMVFLSLVEKNKDKLSLIRKLIKNQASEEEEKIYVDTTVSILKEIGINADPELILSETRQTVQNYQAL